MRHNVRKKILAVLVIIISLGFIALKAFISNSPSTQLLIGIVGFSESTLKNSNYLFYNIDLMDLFQNYMNSDITFEGQAYIKRMDSFQYSTSGSISGERSFNQSELKMTTDMCVLWADLGGLDLYAQDETIYMVVPMLDDLSCAFNTEVNLFAQAPTLTSDISNDWFRTNYTNFINFFNSIEIEKTDTGYIDENGTVSREYKMTIPQGEGDFIWDLLGIDAPDHDINMSMFLDSKYKIHRIEIYIDGDNASGTLVIEGSNCNGLELDLELPDNEEAVMTVTRNSDVKYTNAFISNITYTTNKNKVYTIDCNITMDYTDTGMEGKISDITISDGTSNLLEGYCSGSITKGASLDDVFSDVPVDLSTVEVINWKVLRDNTEDFINALVEQAKENMNIIN